MKMTVFQRMMILAALTAFMVPATVCAQKNAEVEPAILYPWQLSFSLGRIQFEGDEELEGGFLGSLRLAYDYNDRWTLEGTVFGTSELAANDEEFPEQEDAALIGIAFDGIFHFTRWDRVDPFLSLGIGYSHYTEDLENNNQDDVDLRGGVGVMYHVNDNWSLRADARGLLADYTGSPNANSLIDVGLVWRWSDEVSSPKGPDGKGGEDVDGDGLTYDEESAIGTNYLNPDTDGDGVNDGDEVKRKTDPLK